jgi:hypothetical protein
MVTLGEGIAWVLKWQKTSSGTGGDYALIVEILVNVYGRRMQDIIMQSRPAMLLCKVFLTKH